MRLACALACSLIPVVASAATGDAPAPVSSGAQAPVIGGDSAPAGKWPDVAAIMFPSPNGDKQRCTGTLVASTVVLTAGHCFDALDPPLPDNVLIGTSSLARPGDGETIAIARGSAFPDAINSEDLAVLVLARPSRRAPRAIASGWARFDIVNGAPIAVVGFGAINATGDQFVEELQEATTTITDFDCSRSDGCNTAAQPAGELGAGGMGIDTCPGDSGGPLYLTTRHGVFLAGVTSRSYADANVACSEGGIYGRPDKVLDWIEAEAGVRVTRGPEPEADPITAVRGGGGDTAIHVNDPASDAHRFEITAPPAHGTANLRGDGTVRVCTDPAAPPGDDELTVLVTDTRHAGRALPVTIKVQIQDGTAPPTCDLAAFSSGGGCDAGGRAGGAIPLTIGVLALVRRRRR